MKWNATGGLALCAVLVSGCSTYSSNMRVGNDMSYASLGDQRTASQTIKVFDVAPTGAEGLGELDAGRCHRSFFMLLNDHMIRKKEPFMALFALQCIRKGL